ncbi:ATP synthase subunit b [Sphaerisporangium krabiense]|uniref:ATP synthase subunit b n=1 Tax=Sphaerisporangium krabiense TaxID=763782 RepID=A0A7W8YYZ5_9ACTN|nr:F0F1 ATP synthase subunit B [Sphaerisporangium krabiense]MBB5624423.1 F-type H+-transporting ATPase subunit b [Sphaerisporangium krabiense]GII61621.1 ATP synthase subunit b [Sphaerisporangium krabiense]
MYLVAAEEAPNPLLPGVAEMVVGGFAFLLVLFFVGRLLVPRLQKTLEMRADAIEGGLKRAEEAQAAAQRTLEEYRAKLDEARHDAARLREEAREQAAQIKAELREEAQAEARRLIESAHAQIEADRRQAFAQLQAELGRLATDLAGRIVGESLEDEARQSRVVDRFLTELESADGAAVR